MPPETSPLAISRRLRPARRWPHRHDVAHPDQSPVRALAQDVCRSQTVVPTRHVPLAQLDSWSTSHDGPCLGNFT